MISLQKPPATHGGCVTTRLSQSLKMKSRVLGLMMSVLISGACSEPVDQPAVDDATTATATSTKRLGFGENGSAVQLYRWKWQDIMANLGRIRDMGFTTILVSPHMATCAGEFSTSYLVDPDQPKNLDALASSPNKQVVQEIEHLKSEHALKEMAINARAPFILMQALVLHLKAARRLGSVVNIITRSGTNRLRSVLTFCARSSGPPRAPGCRKR